jgi:glutathione peroxidase
MNAFDFQANLLDGTPADLSRWRGQIVLIVNTASKCGFTPQYAGLEQLYERFRDRGFAVLGFPCNQFGQQEPGSEAEIGVFCQENYRVHFPMFAKVDVNGERAHPLFKHLKQAAPGVLGTEMIKWNFTKFLINKDGTVAQRYAPQTKPEDIAADVERLLDA